MAVYPKQSTSRQGVTQALAIGAASVTLPNAFGSETFQVRLASTTACYYLIDDPSNLVAATATNAVYLPANWVEYVTVSPGQKLTAIEASAAGTLTVTEVS